MTSVVHCKRQHYDIYIGRPSKYQNPFRIGVDGNRKQVIQMYREYVLETFAIDEIVEDLDGKILGCWCKPSNCHGDVLVSIIEGRRLGVI